MPLEEQEALDLSQRMERIFDLAWKTAHKQGYWKGCFHVALTWVAVSLLGVAVEVLSK